MANKQMALTFDDGPTIGITDQVLDLLEKEGVRASFFLIGQQVTPETEYLVRREQAMGCSIENHSFSSTFVAFRKHHAHIEILFINTFRKRSDHICQTGIFS